mmetsp:Transcript_8411/g.12164  ORF Transcript_8411/g.12164 Transcript_8411/m.12164 type:complete len:106 (-) Transcript_8411:15-332(-)
MARELLRALLHDGALVKGDWTGHFELLCILWLEKREEQLVLKWTVNKKQHFIVCCSMVSIASFDINQSISNTIMTWIETTTHSQITKQQFLNSKQIHAASPPWSH